MVKRQPIYSISQKYFLHFGEYDNIPCILAEIGHQWNSVCFLVASIS